MPPPAFSPKAITFLRGLKRHNTREWFLERKAVYERELRAPMVALVEQLDREFRAFAPDLIASPKVSLFRIHRDTRFSEDKSPYKTQVSAVFPSRALSKNGGAGLYFEINPQTVWMGGGLYKPTTAQIHAVREHLAANLTRYRSIVEAPGFRTILGGIEGDLLQRVPRGFDKQHPAATELRRKQFLVSQEHPVRLATTPEFYPLLLKVFRAAAPLVHFLNEPLVRARRIGD
jgi:uncharacterized protein (TIGR02453 family)